MSIYEISFSPTGGTKKVADFLANELSRDITNVDLSNGKEDFHRFSLTKEDVAVVAVPSYSGRVPSTAAERISKIQGNGAKAIIVCVYGNRAYEDTLVELQDLLQQAGFSVVSAVAAIAEHSIAHRYATNRPDEKDYEQLKGFADKIGDKLKRNDFTTPGNTWQQTIQEGWRGRCRSQAYEGVYPMRSVCCQMPCRSHRPKQPGKSEQKSLYFMYALRLRVSSSGEKSEPLASCCREYDAEKGMY